MKNITKNIEASNSWLKNQYAFFTIITLADIMKRFKQGNFLGTSNAKTTKGEIKNYLTAILYLAPHKICGVNLCPFAVNCIKDCLFMAGRGKMINVSRARIVKTLCYLLNKDLFVECIKNDVAKLKTAIKFSGEKLAIRLNGTSDTNVLKDYKEIMQNNLDVIFYDYTKVLNYVKNNDQVNYHLTFSYDGQNMTSCEKALELGTNVSMVFIGKLPATYKGYKVINGDETDLRFLDEKGVIVGLTYKKVNKNDIDETFVISL